MNNKECLLMALEISLDSHRELAPSASYRLLNDLPSDTKEFLVNSVTFDRERIQSWSTNEALPLQIKVAREVIEVESSLLESGPQYDYAQDQNVHDERVHANFVRQFFFNRKSSRKSKNPSSGKSGNFFND